MSMISSERYSQGPHLLNFVVYTSTTGSGDDEVLQHKYHGVEMSHVTRHPDGTVNFRTERDGNWLRQFVNNNLAGFYTTAVTAPERFYNGGKRSPLISRHGA